MVDRVHTSGKPPRRCPGRRRFLGFGLEEPAALVVEGEAGIGKTALWTTLVQQSRDRGFRVLSARPAEAESTLAYASLADLLAGADDPDDPVFRNLPDPQRHAIDRVLLRAEDSGEPTNRRAVVAAFLSILENLTGAGPVLVAVDDLQWLDPSSAHVLAGAARRLRGPVGVLGTVRTQPGDEPGASWLRLPDSAVDRICLAPLTIGALHALLSERFGRSFPRSAMVSIHEVSGGNPFYAIELARAVAAGSTDTEGLLPRTLTELVRARIGGLDSPIREVLLAAACASAPTVPLLARVMGVEAADIAAMLHDAHTHGVIGIDGDRLRFTHPLLARGVYTDAAPGKRRAMHRRLAEVVTEREPAARHLALSATIADPATLISLDDAAEMARTRGAPAAAAELVELAIGLGGDTPVRQIRLARHHFDAGDPARARSVLEKTIGALSSGPLLGMALALLALVRLADDSFADAAALLERGLDEVADDLALQVQMLVTLTFVRINTGALSAAQDSVEAAVSAAERLGAPQPLSHALAMRVTVGMFRGRGVDEPGLARALELEDADANAPVFIRASTQEALLLAWTGQLDRAHNAMTAVRQRCLERGEENELAFLAFHSALIEVWRGDFAEATRIAEDTMERAGHLGGDQPLFVALTIRATLAACAGRVEEARTDTAEALAAGVRSNSHTRLDWPVGALGFLEVSVGDHTAALKVLAPLLSRLEVAPDSTEMMLADFVPDAVEALIQLDRLSEAEPHIERLERNGRRLDRPWMLAIGGRCRAMLSAARGDLTAAAAQAQQAMEAHERLPMPLERARTQLLLGQIQRRQRRKDAAAQTLGEALSAFEAMGIPLWAEKVRAELARCEVVPRRAGELTPGERRVAELAARGMTNREVAAALFMSRKTVDANLSRAYRKLEIHSRAELGRHVGDGDAW